jgi:hypothetical protein
MLRIGYETYVFDGLGELKEGQELEIEVRDAQTYIRKKVKAIVAHSADKLTDGENLWIRSPLGVLLDERPWRIKINQVIKEI